ncbi:MAG: hypothetical protein MI723_16300 [Caulobacterales bacterium]|nr:hypothetical protein [Caulobacterales bacterium]
MVSGGVPLFRSRYRIHTSLILVIPDALQRFALQRARDDGVRPTSRRAVEQNVRMGQPVRRREEAGPDPD